MSILSSFWRTPSSKELNGNNTLGSQTSLASIDQPRGSMDDGNRYHARTLLYHDPFYEEEERFPDYGSSELKSQHMDSKPSPTLPTDPAFIKLAKSLDIKRITNRVIAMGMCWRNRTESKSHRNNVDEMAKFLNTRYPKRYMVWNLGGLYLI